MTNELIDEVLTSVQAQVGVMREDMTSVKSRLTSPGVRMAQIHGDLAEVSGRMDRPVTRMERGENRLNITVAEH